MGNKQSHDYCERSSVRQIVILRSVPEPAVTLTQSLLNSEKYLNCKAASINFSVEEVIFLTYLLTPRIATVLIAGCLVSAFLKT